MIYLYTQTACICVLFLQKGGHSTMDMTMIMDILRKLLAFVKSLLEKVGLGGLLEDFTF